MTFLNEVEVKAILYTFNLLSDGRQDLEEAISS